MGVIAILVILLFTLFAVRTVKVDYRTSTTQNMPSAEQIVEAGEFSYGTPIMFIKKKNFINKIQDKYPYVEVINIETVFPNTLVVHVKEREETYAIKHEGKIYYLDNYLKVLRIDEGDFESSPTNPILISGINIKEELQVGQILKDKNYVDVYNAFVANNRLLYQQKEIVKSIEFSSYKDINTQETTPCLTICTYDNILYYIYNSNLYLNQKITKFLAVFTDFYNLVGKEVTKDSSSPYFGQVWTLDMLKSAYVVINNNYIIDNQDDCVFANVFPKQQIST